MSISEFYDSTLADTITWVDARAKARYQSERSTGEYFRWLGSLVVNVFGGKRKIKPKDLFKFPDEETSGEMVFVGGKVQLTPEQEALKEKMLIAALKYQNGNNRQRNDKNRG